MAYIDEQHEYTTTLRAEAAITKGYPVKQGTAQNGAALAGDGEAGIGVAAESAASGETFLVVCDGQVMGIAGDVIALGAQVSPAATNKFVTATTGEFIWGRARSAAGADGDQFIIELIRGKATAA